MRAFLPGETIVEAGDQCDSLYFISEGQVELISETGNVLAGKVDKYHQRLLILFFSA